MPKENLLPIGKVAEKLNTTTRTVRYYEELGLITPFKKTPSSQRLYTAQDVEKIIRIKELHNLMGFKLSEIKTLLEIEDRLSRLKENYRLTSSTEKQLNLIKEALDLYNQLIAQVDSRITQIQQFKSELQKKKQLLLKKLKSFETLAKI
jgi:DNA-binding transcriptional MerR regulator